MRTKAYQTAAGLTSADKDDKYFGHMESAHRFP